MKAFLKFIGFIAIWCMVYYILGRLFNWGLDLLGNALNLDTIIGKLILVSVCSSVLWTILFYPTMIISAFFLDRKTYATIALVLMLLFNLFCLLYFYQLGWVMIVVWIVHAFSTIFPIWIIRCQLATQEEQDKAERDQAYRDSIKNEILREINNGKG